MGWKVPYTTGKFLERRCLKWTCMTHLGIWNTRYGQKKAQKSNRQFDSRPLKVKNRLNFLVWRWRATYRWKDLDKGYNFSLYFISIRGLHANLWAPKVVGVLVVRISRFPLGSPGTKCHSDVGPMAGHKVYFKGEGGGFPQVRAVVSFVNLSCLWWVLGPKVFQYALTNFLFGLCRSMWVIDCFSFFLVSSWSFNTPL